MDRSAVIYLLTPVYTQDAKKIQTVTYTPRLVYVNVSSITLSEYTEGVRIGLNPEFRFTMFSPEYHGEKELTYNGVTYTIYRTYRGSNETLELYAERKQGNNYVEPAEGANNGNDSAP